MARLRAGALPLAASLLTKVPVTCLLLYNTARLLRETIAVAFLKIQAAKSKDEF